ncbi:MAG: FAD-dependent thymidylate synthase [Myxococcota bacterium]|nr:FAD-dependent thymidylate synthase [Myxococcota bacterium]
MKLTAEEQAALDASRAYSATTRRPTVAALEERMYTPLPCLDHGFVRLIDYMGSDAAIVQAARVSYGEGTKKVRQDRGLIRYLLRNAHTSPFEMCELKLHCKMPIFVARQWVRHRTASLNEVSARYSVLDKEFYLPAPQDIAVQAVNNRQGRAESLSPEQSALVLELLKRDSSQAYETYERLLGEEFGLARELARMNLPVNLYTQWYWKIDLHNLLRFLRLRMDAHAQYEIRVFADAIATLVADWVPLTFEAFSDFRVGGRFLSRHEAAVLRDALAGKPISQETSGLSMREWRGLVASFDLKVEG